MIAMLMISGRSGLGFTAVSETSLSGLSILNLDRWAAGA